LDATGFARVNVVVIMVWMIVAALVLRHYRKRAASEATRDA
jgi:hypothetical protein